LAANDLGIGCRTAMIQMKASQPIFLMYNVSNLSKFSNAFRKMYTGLFGMFPAISGNRYGLGNNHPRTVFRNLSVKSHLVIGHRTVGFATPYLDRGKNKSIDKLQMTQLKTLEHSFHDESPFPLI
jgi:hypothetical protein